MAAMWLQKTEMKSAMFAYIHWTTGRAALVFGFVNMFFGIARYEGRSRVIACTSVALAQGAGCI